MIVRSYSRNKPCIRPEHIIRLSSTHHLSALNISSESSELFIRNIRTFRQKTKKEEIIAEFNKQQKARHLNGDGLEK